MTRKSIRDIAYLLSPSVIHPVFERIEASDVGSRLARGVFWSIAGTVISRGLMLCATIFVARMLGKTAYGQLAMIQSTVGMLGVFAGFGLGLTATKYVAEYRRCDPSRAGRIIGLSGVITAGAGGLMSLGLLLFAPWLAENTINAPQLAGVLRIGALILFISVLNGAQTGALAGFEAFKTIARVNLLTGLISFPTIVSGAYLGGVNGVVLALVINLGVNWILNHFAIRTEAQKYRVPFTIKNCSQEFPILWKFSLPAFLAGSMVGPVNWVCAALLVNQPDGYGEMGIYNAANQWFSLLILLPGVISSVILPAISDQLGQNSIDQSIKTLIFAITVNFFMVVPIALVACIASPHIMGFFGEGFAGAWLILVVIVITAGLVALTSPVGQIIAGSGRMWVGFGMNAAWALFFVLLTIYFVNLGALGLALARLLAYVLHSAGTFVFVYYFIQRKV